MFLACTKFVSSDKSFNIKVRNEDEKNGKYLIPESFFICFRFVLSFYVVKNNILLSIDE